MLSPRLSIPPQRRGVTAGPTVDRGVTDTAMGSSFGWISWWWNRLLIGIPWDTSEADTQHGIQDMNREPLNAFVEMFFFWCGLNLDISDKQPTEGDRPVLILSLLQVMKKWLILWQNNEKHNLSPWTWPYVQSPGLLEIRRDLFFLLRKLIYQIPGNLSRGSVLNVAWLLQVYECLWIGRGCWKRVISIEKKM